MAAEGNEASGLRSVASKCTGSEPRAREARTKETIRRWKRDAGDNGWMGAKSSAARTQQPQGMQSVSARGGEGHGATPRRDESKRARTLPETMQPPYAACHPQEHSIHCHVIHSHAIELCCCCPRAGSRQPNPAAAASEAACWPEPTGGEPRRVGLARWRSHPVLRACIPLPFPPFPPARLPAGCCCCCAAALWLRGRGRGRKEGRKEGGREGGRGKGGHTTRGLRWNAAYAHARESRVSGWRCVRVADQPRESPTANPSVKRTPAARDLSDASSRGSSGHVILVGCSIVIPGALSPPSSLSVAVLCIRYTSSFALTAVVSLSLPLPCRSTSRPRLTCN
jgi:hypothetical protein